MSVVTVARADAKLVDQALRHGGWTFLTNHAHVLLCLAQNPDIRLRDVAAKVQITERAVQRIISELEVSGVITRTRVGRRNCYRVNSTTPLRHPLEAKATVADLLRVGRQ